MGINGIISSATTRAQMSSMVDKKSQEKINNVTTEKMAALARAEDTSFDDDHFQGEFEKKSASSYFEKNTSILKNHLNHPQVEVLAQKINDIPEKMAAAETNMKHALQKYKNLSAAHKEALISANIYLAGYQEAKKIQHEIAALATSLEKKESGHPATLNSASKNTSGAPTLNETLRDLEAMMAANKRLLKGHAAVQSLNAKVIFEKSHQLNIFDNNALPGTERNTTNSAGIELGTAIKGGKLFKTGLSAGATVKHSSTVSKEGYKSFALKNETSMEGTAKAKATLAGVVNAAISGTATRTLITDTYKADSVDAIIKHGNIHSMSNKLPGMQNIYQQTAPIREFFNSLSSASKGSTIPLNATAKKLEDANSSHVLINHILEKHGKASIGGDVFKMNDVDPLSTGTAPASTPGSKKAEYNANLKQSIGSKLEVGIGPIFSHDRLNDVHLFFRSKMPQASATMTLSTNIEQALSNGVTLKPAHELLSTAYTGSLEASLHAAEKKLHSWNDSTLPAHIKEAKIFFDERGNNSTASVGTEKLAKDIETAKGFFDSLQEDFAKIEKATAQLAHLTHSSVDFASPSNKKSYNEALSVLKGYQIDSDQKSLLKEIPDEQLKTYGLPKISRPSSQSVQEMAEKAWDTCSVATGMVELAVTAEIKKSPITKEGLTPYPDLKKNVDEFAEKYKSLTTTLASPSLPFSLEDLYRSSSITSPAFTEKMAQTDKWEGAASAEIAGGSKNMVFGRSSNTKTTVPTVVTNPLDNEKAYTDTHTLTTNGILTGALDSFIWEGKMRKTLSNANIPDKDIPQVLEAIRSYRFNKVNAEYFKSRHSPSMQPSMTPVHAFKNIMQGAIIGKTHSDQINLTIDRTDGDIQKVTVSDKRERGVKLDSGTVTNLPTKLNMSLTANVSQANSRTNILSSVMGPDFSQNISNFKNLEEFGIDKEVMKEVKQHMTLNADAKNEASALNKRASIPKENLDQLKKQFKKFFEATEKQLEVRQFYFGANAVGGFLDSFAQSNPSGDVNKDENGNLMLKKFDIFKTEPSQIYMKKKLDADISAKNISSFTPGQTKNIFETIGVDPSRIKALLDSPKKEFISAQGISQYQLQKLGIKEKNQSVREFLESTSLKERWEFFKGNDIGAELFGAYLLVVNGAKEVKGAFDEKKLMPLA